MNLNLMTSEEMVEYLDSLPCWDDDMVEPMLEELSYRLGIDMNEYKEYGALDVDKLFDAVCEKGHYNV